MKPEVTRMFGIIILVTTILISAIHYIMAQENIQLTQPQQMFTIISFVGFIFFWIVREIKNYWILSENKKTMLGIAVIFYITLFLISFSAVMGPLFFHYIGYNVSDVSSDTITAFDATTCLTGSIVAATIGYISIDMAKKGR